MISQQTAPYKVSAVDPGKTADSTGFGIASDGQTYVIKSPQKHPLLPATEAFCESLAIACQLPTTVGAWLDVGGVWCYGSRFEGGLSRPLVRGSKLEIAARKRDWQRCSAPQVASAAFAFDLFVFNWDHHHNNWAFQDQNATRTARMFDFSRAWWVNAADPSQLPPPGNMQHMPASHERTCATFRDVCKWTPLDTNAARKVLDSLASIGAHWVDRQMQSLPTGWLDDSTKAATLQWWSSPLKQQRIDEIDQGLKNGNLF